MPRGWFGPKPESWKAAISEKLTGKKKTDDHRTSIGDARRGKKYPRKPKDGKNKPSS